MRGLVLLLCLWLSLLLSALGQGVDVLEFGAAREEGGIVLDFAVQLALPRAVDEALQRGVPIYFRAQAVVLRPRWYWRDERVARASKSWRLSYQPLTSSWRVSQGGLHQTYASQAEALASISRAGRWKIAEAERIEADARYVVEFGYRLDTEQLPRPMQIGIGTLADWAVGVERSTEIGPAK